LEKLAEKEALGVTTPGKVKRIKEVVNTPTDYH
jgi:hypothetical protein